MPAYSKIFYQLKRTRLTQLIAPILLLASFQVSAREFTPNYSNHNGIPGKQVNTDVSFASMTGQADELRGYNIPLPNAYIRALYNLGKAVK